MQLSTLRGFHPLRSVTCFILFCLPLTTNKTNDNMTIHSRHVLPMS